MIKLLKALGFIDDSSVPTSRYHDFRDEAKSGMSRVYRNFDAIDSAHAGSITLAQIEAYVASQRGKRSGGAP